MVAGLCLQLGWKHPAPEPENRTRGDRGAQRIEPYFSAQFNEHTVQFGSFAIAFRQDTSNYTVKCPYHSDPQAGIRCTKPRKVQFQKGDTHQNVVKRMMHWCLVPCGTREPGRRKLLINDSWQFGHRLQKRFHPGRLTAGTWKSPNWINWKRKSFSMKPPFLGIQNVILPAGRFMFFFRPARCRCIWSNVLFCFIWVGELWEITQTHPCTFRSYSYTQNSHMCLQRISKIPWNIILGNDNLDPLTTGK